jgi:signal transduction histidine kinase
LQVDPTVDLAYEAGRAATRHAPELKSTLYRLVQEALTNAVEHADASRVVIEVQEDDHAVHVGVRDDGIGFAPDDASEGFGLLAMSERVALAGGYAARGLATGANGTSVTGEIPVRRRDTPERSDPADRVNGCRREQAAP